MAEGLKNGKLGYGHVKNMLLEAIIEKTGQEREVYNYYMNHFDEVEKILAAGAEKARTIAGRTLQRLKRAVLRSLKKRKKLPVAGAFLRFIRSCLFVQDVFSCFAGFFGEAFLCRRFCVGVLLRLLFFF